ncbi:hypothetical protein C1896_01835 [Pseudomonadaceae bacterium SI-3]|nr:hypothetical protein C1896_01835 [Pseudomonadaceae bacterium SI-3]
MVLLALPRYSGHVLTEYITILQQPGSEQITRCISSGSILVDGLLTLLEVGHGVRDIEPDVSLRRAEGG